MSSTVPERKRTELQKALAVLELGDTLVVSKLDRLGRTQREVVALLAYLQAKGVFVRTLDGLLNTAGLGKLGGRPPLTKERQQLVQRLRAAGKSFPAVAQALGVSVSTAHRYGKAAAVA